MMELLNFCFASSLSGVITVFILFMVGSFIYAMYEKHTETKLKQLEIQSKINKNTKNV